MTTHLTDAQHATLEGFVTAVEASPHNLVSKQARVELRERHLAESVAFAQRLPSSARRILDIGSGGGFPGLVIAILRPDTDVHLLDSTRKKAEFLRTVAADLGITVAVHNGRAEELARTDLAGTFDVVTARAVASLDRLIPWTLPFLRPGGEVFAIKGERWREELAEATAVLDRFGGRIVGSPDDDALAIPPGEEGVSPLVVRIARSST